jgi:hypothetical protein
MDQPPFFGSVLDVERDRASCHTGPSLDNAEWGQRSGHKPEPGTVRVSADSHYLLVSSHGTVIDRPTFACSPPIRLSIAVLPTIHDIKPNIY